jgi:hypothetical protein
MSIISDLFKPANRNQGPMPPIENNPGARTPGQPGGAPQDRFPQNNPNADPRNGIPPSGSAQPTNPPEPISPLDQFKDVWQPKRDEKGNVISEPNPLAQPLITSDPAKFAEAARKMNFTNGIDPAVVAKALGGDAEAFMSILNQSNQNAFMAASQLSTNMVEGAAKTNNSRFESVLQDKFKEFMVRQEQTENPVLQHAAVSPMLDLAKQQLMRKHPDKTAGQIQQMAEQMLGDFADAYTGNKTQQTQQRENPNQSDPFDFSKFG